MKRLILAMLLIVLFILSCSSCTKTNHSDTESGTISENQNEALMFVSDYFPIQDNVKLSYEGDDNEFAGFTVDVEFTTNSMIQQRICNGATETVNVLELTDGKLIRRFWQGETYYRMNFLDRSENPEILLMEPLQNGTSWTLTDGRIRSISEVSAQVVTPSGTYTAIEVTTFDPQKPDEKSQDYYASSVGLVKTVYSFGETPDEQISASLEKIENEAVMTQMVKFYYPDPMTDGLIFQVKTVSFHTNDPTRKVLEDAYKNNAPWPVLSAAAEINSLYLNQDGMVYIDLNPAFITGMNAGSGYEGLILQSIANTFGNYYGAQRVILTVAGEPYASGHIMMEKGQYLEVVPD